MAPTCICAVRGARSWSPSWAAVWVGMQYGGASLVLSTWRCIQSSSLVLFMRAGFCSGPSSVCGQHPHFNASRAEQSMLSEWQTELVFALWLAFWITFFMACCFRRPGWYAVCYCDSNCFTPSASDPPIDRASLVCDSSCAAGHHLDV